MPCCQGARHDTSPPKFSALRSQCCGNACPLARRAGAKLSVAARHHDRDVSCGRRGGRDRARNGRADAAAVGTTGDDRRHRGGGRRHRRGAGSAARARPDGYTICLGVDATFVLNGAFYSLPYDVLNDFVPISPLATGPTVLVARKTMPAADLSELIAWLKVHPNQASAGMNNLRFPLPALRL